MILVLWYVRGRWWRWGGSGQAELKGAICVITYFDIAFHIF